ncbi:MULTISPECIES: C4-dicarboxylate transporter DctA [Arthrobacter]|uniref:Na+/H+-dicarboxylate symporter n=1 Tax=Arthrobacter bambusae TaxID=1338426 RepID=A0AAW8DF32_9MICC|nr:C4-dicarboxylate transporter DctA [Arthrobacter bambusae]MDP9904506.1 Na+/H+-dicarboxylate symporter [Arthrobacter bambusae]MDQ0127499.1 Na+/H+-dicarboxylate symporter [Arthrobacter bambusae]MDQ0178841.1 Na+/H+-dicarboxylate symporter [Arthrobacter bambusae]MDQ0239643.1 Na+/H+-dicarboxylate symporter [Arthrobacter bambusae]
MKIKSILGHLYVQVLIGVGLGILVGALWPDLGSSLKPLGDGFVKLVKFMIAPIVFCTIVSGITSLTDTKKVGPTLLRSLGLFYALTAVALAIGLGAVMLFQPGAGMHINPAHLDTSVASKYTSQLPSGNPVDFVMSIIPSSFVGAFADGEVLPVLVIALLCGFAFSRLGAPGQLALNVVNSFNKLLFVVFGFLMKVAPIGAFGAMAFTVGKYGAHSIGNLGLLILAFYAACIVFVVLVLGILAKLTGFSLWRILRYFRDEFLIVLATSSSEPVLPRLLSKLERLGCDRGVVGLVVPTGYSFNLTGTAVYLTLSSMFIAQACDIHLGWDQILLMLGMMLLTSKGAAGVTGSGFVALVATLTVMPTLPVAGVALIVGIDRFMSEARALTSTVANIVSCVAIAKWQHALDTDKLRAELQAGFVQTEAEKLQLSEPVLAH